MNSPWHEISSIVLFPPLTFSRDSFHGEGVLKHLYFSLSIRETHDASPRCRLINRHHRLTFPASYSHSTDPLPAASIPLNRSNKMYNKPSSPPPPSYSSHHHHSFRFNGAPPHVPPHAPLHRDAHSPERKNTPPRNKSQKPPSPFPTQESSP